MGRYSSGRFAQRISDRDGFAYPYNEMVQEWTGSWVHTSEYEPKSPQLDPTNHPHDPQSLQHPRSQQVHATVPVGNLLALGVNSFQSVGMQPLSATSQKNLDTRMNSFVGTVTVVIS
jgi:hypothetical protein